MIPFTRITTFLFFIGVFLCAFYEIIDMDNHPFMSFEAMIFLVLASLLIFLISLYRNFVTDLIAILWTAYITQRIIVIYIFPEEMDYQEYISFDNEIILRASIFIFFSAFALAFGGFISLYQKKFSQQFNYSVDNRESFIAPIKLFGRFIDFNQLVSIISWIVIIGNLLRIYTMLFLKIGFTGSEYERESAVLIRPSQMGSSLNFIVFFASVVYWEKISRYKIILFALALIILDSIFLTTSKGAIIALILSYIISLYFYKGYVPKKILIYGAFAVLFSSFFYFSIATQLRSILLEYGVGIYVSFENFEFSIVDTFLKFCKRLGGFDWLVGIMRVGRESFYPSANLWIDIESFINALVPGDIIKPADDFIPVAKRIPQLLRGYPDSYISLGGHGELMGGLGMAYIYFGELFGPVFFFFWVWGCIVLLKSSLNILSRIFIINFFLVITFIGGGFTTMFFHMVNIFYLSLLIYFLQFIGSLLGKVKCGHNFLYFPSLNKKR